MPNPATYVNETPIFERYMIWCLIDIALRAQKMRIVLSSEIVRIVGFMWPFNEHENLHFDTEWDIHAKIYEANGYKHDVMLLTISYSSSVPILS
jgi:hypothetical protein